MREYSNETLALRDAIVRHREAVLSARDDADYRQADRTLWLTVGDLARGALL